MTDAGDGFRHRITRVLALDPEAPALEFADHWYPWRAYADRAADVRRALDTLGLPDGTQVGVLLRNDPPSVHTIIGVLLAHGCLVVGNPLVGAERVQADVAALGLPLVIGDAADLALLGPHRPATLDFGGALTPASSDWSTHADARRDVAIRLLTSGTTGPPKRSDLTYATLGRVLHGAKHYESAKDDAVRLHEGAVIVNAPMVHLGGLFRVVQAVNDGRRISLLERFTVAEWVDRVRTYRPKTASLVPTALRMVYDADLDPADLASLRSVISGTAPLNPELADAFTARYGVPVLTNYAATEFGGGVAGWNLRDHREFWAIKRGSVGRAHAGCALRVVDEATGVVLGADEVGLLEVRAEQLESDTWVRTTDLARIDADGFVWIVGRADQTIVRGGLKVQPDTVRRVLERHPAVRAAAVVGVPDERLGQVPVAVVEPVGAATVDPDELLAAASATLTRYEVPVAVVVVDALPRTESGKVDLRATKALAEQR